MFLSGLNGQKSLLLLGFLTLPVCILHVRIRLYTMHACIQADRQTDIHTYIHLHTHMHMRVCLCVCVCVCVYLYTCMPMVGLRLLVCIYVYMYTYMYK